MAEIQKMTGFPSACAEYAEDRLSLDQRYITKRHAMYPIRVRSESRLFDLKKGDELIIDRSLDPIHGDLVMAVISNEFVIAKFSMENGSPLLLPYNKRIGENELGEDFIWGVVSSLHRRFKK